MSHSLRILIRSLVTLLEIPFPGCSFEVFIFLLNQLKKKQLEKRSPRSQGQAMSLAAQ